MPNPTQSSVHTNAPLTTVAMNYIQDQDKFIVDQIFPNVNVSKQSDLYYVFDKDDMLRDEAEIRAPGTESAGGGYRISSSGNTYSCKVYSYHKDVADTIRANADDVLQPDKNATRFVTQKLLIKRERLFAPYMTGGNGNWANEVNNTGGWANDGGTPIKDIRSAMRTVKQNWEKPNVMVMGSEVFDGLIDHATVRDYYKHTSSDVVTEDMLARLFRVDKVLVAEAIYASNKEGGATTEAFALPQDSLLIAYAQPNPTLDAPSAGYTFSWTGVQGAQGMNIGISKFRMKELKADRIEGEMAFDIKITGPSLGYLIYNCFS